jgi:hypothetical protein
MRGALRYDVRTVGYNFEDVNPFKGHPVSQIDEEWSNVLNGGRSNDSIITWSFQSLFCLYPQFAVFVARSDS